MKVWTREYCVTCVVCPDCAFTFDVAHTDVDGVSYSCPACAEIALERRLAEIEAAA